MSYENIRLQTITSSTKYQWNKLNQNRIERLLNYVKHEKKLVNIFRRSVNSHGLKKTKKEKKKKILL